MGSKEDRYSMLHHAVGKTSVDKNPFSPDVADKRVAAIRSPRKHKQYIGVVKPIIIKYVVSGAGMIFHHVIMLASVEAGTKKINPRKGFCIRMKRRKNIGNNHVARGTIHLPFENNIKIVPVNNQRKD